MTAPAPAPAMTVELPRGRALREYDGWCLELVDSLLHKHPTGRVLYVGPLDGHPTWQWHAALVLDGIVYDAWHPMVRLPPAEYVAEVFGGGVEWEVIEGDEG